MMRAIVLCVVTLLLAAYASTIPTSPADGNGPVSNRAASVIEPMRDTAKAAMSGKPAMQDPAMWPSGEFDMDLRQSPVDHWTLLRRATGTAVVDLKDAAGESLQPYRFSTSLFRRLGQWWVPYQVCSQYKNGILTLGGDGEPAPWSMGLEPGEYELEVNSYLYGSVRCHFEIQRDGVARLAIRTPRFRRVICFRFVDEQGNPVSHVGFPSVVPSQWSLPDVARPQPDKPVLQRPPSEAPAERRRYCSSSISCGFGVRQDTDSGACYVEVGAGQPSRITFGLGTLWGQDKYEVESDFVGPQYDETKVTLRIAPDFDQAILRYSKTSGKAGNRALVQPPDREVPFNPYTAPAKKGWSRVIVRVPAGWPARVESLCEGSRGYFSFSEAHEVWWTELRRGVPASYRLTDGCFYVSEWLPAPTDEAVSVIDAPPEPLTVSIHGDWLSPTLRAFGALVDFDIGVVGGAPFADPTPPHRQLLRDGLIDRGEERSSDLEAPANGHLIASIQLHKVDGLARVVRLGGRKLDDLSNAEKLATRTRVAGLPRNALWPVGDLEHQHSHSNSRGRHIGVPAMGSIVADSGWQLDQVGGSLLHQLASGTIQPAVTNLLCLKAVGQVGEGLPYVSGTVHELDQDDTALRVRRAMLDQGLQPLKPDDPAAYKAELDAMAPTDTASVAALIGPEAASKLSQADHQYWFARNGTWYDGRNQIHSDDHGYMISQAVTLVPGKVYVLYLWSRSRDASYPDARIVFEAGPGVTDLGVIRLPSYR
ncbi:MAG: hypothetical protein KF754_14965 [Planctomycetes bacterium]|nr:hypothetical protein [Planctomycetota bacterium]